MAIDIILNNNKFKVETTLKKSTKMFKHFKVRHRNAYHIREYVGRGWDGKVNHMSEAGFMSTGLLGIFNDYVEENGWKYDIEDFRDLIEPPALITKLGKYKARDYQEDALSAIVNHHLMGIYFPRGMLKAATNAGKTLICAFLHETFGLKTILLLRDKELFEQAMEEIPEYLGRPIGQISSKKIEWNDFMVCMAATTKNRLQQARVALQLSKYEVCVVDECDLCDTRTHKTIIEKGLFNTIVRVGMSGTIDMPDMDPNKLRRIMGFFGPVVHEIKNKELIEKGYSVPVEVTIHKGNTNEGLPPDFTEQYRRGVIQSKVRNKKIVELAGKRAKQGKLPMLIITKNHKHIRILYKRFTKKFGGKYRIEWVHHKRKDRKEIVRAFKEGEIDILIGSLILKRGKNFPLLRYLCNAGGGKGMAGTLQILGRAFRTHKSKKKVYFDDFYDESQYLRRHSKRRITAYKNEKLEVILKYKIDY